MRVCLSLCVALILTVPASAQDEAARKTIKRILAEIELVPSLYAKGETPIDVKTAPKFSSIKLVGYPIGKINYHETEREKWKKSKEAYERDFPLRAAVLEAAEETKNLDKLEIYWTLPKEAAEPKVKALILQKQERPGMAIFKLEAIYKQMEAAAGQRNKEQIRRWALDFDFAMTRVQGNLVFLYEYNFVLGAIRADNLPELAAGDTGWKIAFNNLRPNVSEQKARQYAKDRLTLLQQIQKDHAGTPWAYYAERDSKRELGMQWAPRKK